MHRPPFRTILFLITLCGVALVPTVWLALAARADGGAIGPQPAPVQATQQQMRAAYGMLPLSFEVNRGQVDERVKFSARGLGYNLFITAEEAVLTLRAERSSVGEKGTGEAGTPTAGRAVLRMKLVGAAADARVVGHEELSGKVNYLLGDDPAQWRTDVPTFAQVQMANIYRGIDLVYYGNQGQLEYDFTIAPGADPRAIKLRFQGADRLRLDECGDLLLMVAGGEVRLHKPVLYQPAEDGTRREVAGQYVLAGAGTVGFRVGAYDTRRPLVIDPIFVYGTYLGNGEDVGNSIAVDAQGSAYIVGRADSDSFPTTGQNFIPNGDVFFSSNAFVTKLDPTGTTLIYSTLVGGSGTDKAFGVALDQAGNAYVTGQTSSSNFPTLRGVKRKTSFYMSADGAASWHNDVTGLNADVLALAVDPTNPATLYAATSSGLYRSADGGSTWQRTANAGVPSASFGVLVVDPTTPAVLYAGSGNDGTRVNGLYKSTDRGESWTQVSLGEFAPNVNCIVFDPVNSATMYVGTSTGVFKSTDSGGTWASANAGMASTDISALAVTPSMPATLYTGTDSGIYKSTNGGDSWSAANAGLYSSCADAPTAVAVAPKNPNIVYMSCGYFPRFGGFYIFKSNDAAANWTQADSGVPPSEVNHLIISATAPTTAYASTQSSGIIKTVDGGANWAPANAGLWTLNVRALINDPTAPAKFYAGTSISLPSEDDAFIFKLNAAGNGLVYSTYLGGASTESGNGIAVDAQGSAYVVGETYSTDFPTINPLQPALKGATDAFVAKLTPDGDALSYATYLGGSAADSGRAIALDQAGSAYVTGNAYSTDFPTTADALHSTKSSPDTSISESFAAKLTPVGSGLAYSTYLGIGRAGNGIAVDAQGSTYVAGQTGVFGFPEPDPHMPTPTPGDAFVTKLNATGSALIYSTLLGGRRHDVATGIALDQAGNAYVTGSTDSSDFPVTADALKSRSPLFKTTDGGALWNNYNIGLSADVLNCIAIDPTNPATLYVGLDNGVGKSIDGGQRWRFVNVGLGAGTTPAGVVALAVDPQTPTTLYASVGVLPDGGGSIYKSMDGGDNWEPINNGMTTRGIYALVIDPASPATIYVGGSNGISKTVNGGANWTQPSTVLSSVLALVIDPTNTATLYAACNSSTGGIFKSADGGVNWVNIGGGILSPNATNVAVDPTQPNTLYASTGAGLYKTTDGGAHWTLSNPVGGAIAINPLLTSTIYLSAAGKLLKSVDGGDSWHDASNGLVSGVGPLAIDPVTPTNVYAVVSQMGTKIDAFVAKLNAAGSTILYSTYLGGRATNATHTISDTASGIAVDAQGDAYVVGASSSFDFPVTPEAYQIANRGYTDAFVAKLAPAASIGGRVTDANGAPQSGVAVTLTGARQASYVTSSDGHYLFANLQRGSNYTVSAAKVGFTFTPPSQTFNNLNDDAAADFTLAATTTPFHTISGRVTEGGTGLFGINITLTGMQSTFTTTASDGSYSFTLPEGGSYTLTPSALGFTFSQTSQTINNLSADATIDFAATRHPFVVTNTKDHGSGSLRQAITNANATPGADTIIFNIPSAGVQTISLTSALPVINEPVIIDGTTQPGYASMPLVELDGNEAGSNTNGLWLTGGASVVRGLVIDRFGAHGIMAESSGGYRIEGCIIGLDPTGTAAERGNQLGGIAMFNSSDNIIGGTTAAAHNVVAGSTGVGIYISGANNQIKGNFIGTDITGTSARGGQTGIELLYAVTGASTAPNVVGGTEPGARNVIAGAIDGIRAGGDITIQGNFIGSDASGTVAIRNASSVFSNTTGVLVNGNNIVVGGRTAAARNLISGYWTGIQISTTVNNPAVTFEGNFVGTDVTGKLPLGDQRGVTDTLIFGNHTGVQASGIFVGGTAPGAGNLISGNFLGLSVSERTTVQGNLIGTDVTGTLPLGNLTGVTATAARNVIGGTEPGARNVISGNRTAVLINGQATTDPAGTFVQGNLIGLNITGTAAVPNTLDGVAIYNSSGNVIGGSEPGAGNTIAYNGGAGVFISQDRFTSPRTVNNAIRRNAIFSNAGLGINLGENNLQNFPLLTQVTSSGGSTNVRGTLDSTPNTAFTVELFSNAACDPAGNGEGAQFFHAFTVTTDAAGAAAFDISVPSALAAGRVLTATATDPAGNTSEFSPCDVAVVHGSVEFSADRYHVLEDVGSALITVNRVGGSSGTLSVNYATTDGTATAPADYTSVSGTLTFAAGETTKIIEVPIADDGISEPFETLHITLSGGPDLEAVGGQSTAAINILDSNTPLFLSVDAQSFVEGNSGTTNAAVVVRLQPQSGRTVSADFSITPGSASSGVDYQPVSGRITFAPQQTEQVVNVPIIGDTLDEPDENFSLNLFNTVNATPGTFYPLYIRDDDAPPTLSINDIKVTEGNEGTTNANFTVTLSAASGRTVSVGYATANDTATAGSDYTAQSGSVSFSPGETTKTLSVAVDGDTQPEADETFFVNLSSSLNATIARAQGTATILDDDGTAAQLRFSAPTYQFAEAEARASVQVVRTGDTTAPVSVNYQTFDTDTFTVGCADTTNNHGSAYARCDFATVAGTLQFAAGETQKTITIPLIDDAYVEGAETFQLRLSNAQGATLAAPDSATIVIQDNDATGQANPVFQSPFFVRLQYLDFLSREPDEAGFNAWLGVLNGCPNVNNTNPPPDPSAGCDRISVSSGFFGSQEFQLKGAFVFRFYATAFGRLPQYSEIIPDMSFVAGATAEEVYQRKAQLAANFTERAEFVAAFGQMSNADYVGALLGRYQLTSITTPDPAQPDGTQKVTLSSTELVTRLNAGALSRAQVLRAVADSDEVGAAEFNRAFVAMQYYGYLRRTPEEGGFNNWLNYLNSHPTDFRTMVNGFLNSVEYRLRFGQP